MVLKQIKKLVKQNFIMDDKLSWAANINGLVKKTQVC